MNDIYKTIEGESIGEFKDRGSKFLAYAYPVYEQSEWQEKLVEVKKLHNKARHWCYAFRLGIDGTQFRANDDGEPSGTAGRPILGQIDSFGLSNIIIIVVRYFGGTKLGTSGLKNAYKSSAAEALNQANIIEKTIEDIYQLDFEYHLMSEVMNAVKKLELEIIAQSFEEKGQLQIAIRKSEISQTIDLLKAKIAKIRIEEIDQLENIDGFEMKYILTR